MTFDESLYLQETNKLLRAAKAKLISEHGNLIVYTVSIWTDPNAAVSAVGFDTLENSRAVLEQQAHWAHTYHSRAVSEGDVELAKLFEALIGSRNNNPASFWLPRYQETEHNSFVRGWESRAGSKCWDMLEPALRKVGADALVIFADIKLHVEAQLGINSRRDWFDMVWPLRQ